MDPVANVGSDKFIQRDFILLQGNALEAGTWPAGGFDFIISTGLGEFLEDREREPFFENVYATLAPGGVFFTSLTACELRADWLLRAFELRAELPIALRGGSDLSTAALELTVIHPRRDRFADVRSGDQVTIRS